MRRAVVALGVVVAGVAALYLVGVTSRQWELERRSRLAKELRQLTQRLGQDPADPEALRQLTEYMGRSDAWDRMAAFATIKFLEHTFQTHPESRQAVQDALLPAIRQGLDDPDAVVRQEAALAARALGPWAQPAVADLTRLINKYPRHSAAWFAAEALGKIGPGAREAIPALEEAAKQPYVGEYAATALAKIRGEQEQPSRDRRANNGT